ncbi:MAG: phage portal protein [Desulfobulbales bacterium]|nr:phage portal protein [Desulfobulbales bacterium]
MDHAFDYNELAAAGISPILDVAGRPQLSASAQSAFEAGNATSPDYEAASTSHRLGLWGLSGSGPNAALSGPVNTLRARCRTLVRNNAVIAGGVDSLVANLVGTDISPRWELKNNALKERIQELWTDSQEELDAAGIYDFYGMTEQVARALPDAGECLARFRPRRMADNLLVPLQVQLLEADHLDASFDSVNPDNGNEIRMGIEWNKIGQRTAYHLFREHPGERYAYSSAYAGERVRVPASEVLHVFRPMRIGQARGCPWLSSVITKAYEIDQIQDAVLVRQKVANLFAMFVKNTGNTQTGATAAWPGNMPKSTTTSKPVVPVLSPGLSVRLKDGEDVQFSTPPDVGDNYQDLIKQELRFIARGMGIMYEQLSGDLEGVTFSSIRAGVNEFRRLCEMLQVRILVYQWCRPVVRRWLDAAVLSGALAIPDYTENRRIYWRVKWHPDGWNYVDPVKDRLAEQMDVRNGVQSRTAVVAKRGNDIERVDNEQAADQARADSLGLVHDTDPRKTAKSGLMQLAETESLREENK